MYRGCKCLTSIVFLFLAFINTPGQEQAWTKVAPVGEQFRVLMPAEAVQGARIVPLNFSDPPLRVSVYQSVAGGKRYLVIPFTKTAPDRLMALSNFDNFIAAIQQSLLSREGESVTASIFGDEALSGSGKQYHLTLGGYSGIARLLETDKTFYVLMVIGANDVDHDAQRFLSSFTLTETNVEPQANGVVNDVPANSAELERVRTALPPEPWPRTAGPIMGGVLNGKAISLPVPKYPEEARTLHESGTVEIDIIIDEQGNVVWAEASAGPASLRDAALGAARKARFTPTRLMGQPVKVRGRILYNFVAR